MRSGVRGTEWVVKTRSWRLCVSFGGRKRTASFSLHADFSFRVQYILFVLLVVPIHITVEHIWFSGYSVNTSEVHRIKTYSSV